MGDFFNFFYYINCGAYGVKTVIFLVSENNLLEKIQRFEK